jgi:hypothetical protein
MEFIDFKSDKSGELQVTVTEGKFKGYTILIRTSVVSLVFDNKFDPKGHPIFGVTQANSVITIPPKVDVRKDMK